MPRAIFTLQRSNYFGDFIVISRCHKYRRLVPSAHIIIIFEFCGWYFVCKFSTNICKKNHKNLQRCLYDL